MKLEFKDKAGVLLQSGDLIVYGFALGRSPCLRYALVIEVAKSKTTWRATGEHRPVLKIHGVDETSWDVRDKGAAPLLKASQLEFPERVLKVAPEQMPKPVLKVIKELQEKYAEK